MPPDAIICASDSVAAPCSLIMGIMDKTRKTGVLMHITSLPSDYGVGDLGENAYGFVDLLAEGKVALWQMLPLGPTGYGDSPYASRSAFAGNELMISPRSLYIDGYLDISDVMVKAAPSERVDYGSAKALKMPMLRKAALALLSSKGADRKAFESFAEKPLPTRRGTRGGSPSGRRPFETGMRRLLRRRGRS